MLQPEAVERMASVGRMVMEKGLTWGTAGNMSVRLDAEHALVTGSGTRMETLGGDDFTRVRMADHTYEGRKPSKELPVHTAIYSVCPWAGAVLHASPPASTLFSITGEAIRNDLFVENMYYLQRVAFVPYAHPGHPGLVQEVTEVAATHNVILMRHHGVLIYDTTLEEALIGLEILEQTCRMQMEVAKAGQMLPGLPPETVEDFLKHSGYKPTREWR